jgi:hypothetical protein
MRPSFPRLARDQTGTTTIEFTIVALLFFMLTFGLVDFGYLFMQYNSAAKAAQVGARMAAVSDPVWQELSTVKDTGAPGGPWTQNYNVTCAGDTARCTGSAPVRMTYVAANMQRLVYGRGGGATCGNVAADNGDPGMCDIFDRIAPENVSVEYENTGLGFAGRPAGPVPTIILRLTGLTFEFIGLGDLLGLPEITMPDFLVTMTGEDLNASAP